MQTDGFIKIIEDTEELLREARDNIGEGLGQIIGSKKTALQEVEELIIELKLNGSLRERPNGLIEFRNTKLGSVYGRTKEEINEKITKRFRELQSHVKKPKRTRTPKSPLLSEFYRNSYLPYKLSKSVSKSTVTGYESNMRYIADQRFDKPLLTYSATEIESFLYAIPETRKRQIMQGFLNNVFNRAVVLSVVRDNPCAHIEKVEHKQNEGTALEFSEQERFFKTLFSSEKFTRTQKCYFIFVYLTGCRRTEALNVTASDVDFDRKVLHVPGTKTDGSDRYLPLFPLVEKVLRGLTPENGKFFPFYEASVDRILKECLKERKLHDLRHTFGTIQCCCNGVDVKTVSLWMGHSTIQTTLRIYTHPERLDLATFLRGDLTEEEKKVILKAKYEEILRLIYDLLG